MTDPWKHRSAEMTCATCMWFVEKASSQSTLSEDDIEGAWTAGFKKALDSVGTATLDIPEATLRNNWMAETFAEDNVRVLFGRCRRHAPTMQGYPAVFGNDWCGDHKLDENKR